MIVKLKESKYRDSRMTSARASCRQVLQKRTDVLRRTIAPSQEQGGVTLSCVWPHCHRFPLEDWASLGQGDPSKRGNQCNWWCAACGGQYIWRDPNRVFVIQDGADPGEAKAFRAHAPPEGQRENLMCAFRLLANLQSVETIWWTRSSTIHRSRASWKSRMN